MKLVSKNSANQEDSPGWRTVLDKIYLNENDSYFVEDVRSILNPSKSLKEALGTISLSDDHPLAKELHIKGLKLKNSLLFLVTNKLIEQGVATIVPVDHQEDLVLERTPIILSKKGFDVARDNQKNGDDKRRSIINNYLVLAYVFLTFAVAAYYSIELGVSAGSFNYPDGFRYYMFLILIIILLLGYFGIELDLI